MGSTKKSKNDSMFRLSARIRQDQIEFIKSEAKKSKGALGEGDVIRLLFDEAIAARKAK